MGDDAHFNLVKTVRLKLTVGNVRFKTSEFFLNFIYSIQFKELVDETSRSHFTSLNLSFGQCAKY